MDVKTLSDRILDENFGLGLTHSEEDIGNSPPSDENLETAPPAQNESIPSQQDESNALEHYGILPQDESNALEHYGILGMKWGVRRTPEQLGHVKKKDRRYEGETDQQYQARMDRESRERVAKTTAKAQLQQQKAKIKAEAATQKRSLKSQEKREKQLLKSQEKQAKQEAKLKLKQQEADAKLRQTKQEQENKKSKTKTLVGDSTKMMTDQELNDAITRLRKEAEYKALSKKPDGILKKTVKGAGAVGGGVLLAVGKNIATRQLSDIGNQKANDYLTKKGLKKDTGKGGNQQDIDDMRKTIEELRKAMGYSNP